MCPRVNGTTDVRERVLVVEIRRADPEARPAAAGTQGERRFPGPLEDRARSTAPRRAPRRRARPGCAPARPRGRRPPRGPRSRGPEASRRARRPSPGSPATGRGPRRSRRPAGPRFWGRSESLGSLLGPSCRARSGANARGPAGRSRCPEISTGRGSGQREGTCVPPGRVGSGLIVRPANRPGELLPTQRATEPVLGPLRA